MQNFWFYLLEGAGNFLGDILLRLPLHAIIGIVGWASAIMTFAMVPLLVFVGAFFDLRLLGLVVGTIITLEIVRATIAIWRWILSLIPAAS